MFRPVGSQPSSVYWRRRLVFLATLAVVVALLVVTLSVVFGGSDDSPSAGPTGSGGPDSPGADEDADAPVSSR